MQKNFLILLKRYKEQVLYLIFGILTTLVNWLTYSLVMIMFHERLEVANIMAWVVAILFAYITNSKFVFESNKNNVKEKIKEFVMFLGSRIATGIIEIVGVPILYYIGIKQSILGVDGFVAKIVISIIVIILNYIFSKLLVFNNKNKKVH